MNKSIYEAAAIRIFDYAQKEGQKRGRFACVVLDPVKIERLIEENTVTETAWRGAFEHIAKELGVEHIQMSHCSAATFAVLKRIQELNRQLAEQKGDF